QRVRDTEILHQLELHTTRADPGRACDVGLVIDRLVEHDGYVARLADALHRLPVAAVDRLLEPLEPAARTLLQDAGEGERRIGGIGLIGVEHNAELPSRPFAQEAACRRDIALEVA